MIETVKLRGAIGTNPLDAMTASLRALGHDELAARVELNNLLWMAAHREEFPEMPERRDEEGE